MSEYQNGDRRKWHIKKEVSVGDIVAIVSAATAVIYAYTTLDKRITILEQATSFQARVDNSQDETMRNFRQRMDAALATINQKLDRLLESRGR